MVLHLHGRFYLRTCIAERPSTCMKMSFGYGVGPNLVDYTCMGSGLM